MRITLFVLLGVLLGAGFAWYVQSPEAPTQVKETFHTHKTMEIFGFQPYWLIGSEDPHWSKYTSTLAYFGLQIGDGGSIIKVINSTETEPGWNNLQSTKVKNYLSDASTNGVTLSLTVQASNQAILDTLTSNPKESARKLVEELVPIIEEYHFSDINLDIETFTDSDAASQDAFVSFVSTVRSELKKKTNATLSLDVTPLSLFRPRLISVQKLDPYIDMFILMAYDFHYAGSYSTGPVSPLSGSGVDRTYDVNTALSEMIRQSSAEKTLLGTPTYGYEWETLSSDFGAPAIPGTGKTASAKRVKELLENCSECIEKFDEKTGTPYVIEKENGHYHMFYYVNAHSVQRALELSNKLGIRGVAIWAYGYETLEIRDTLASFRR